MRIVRSYGGNITVSLLRHLFNYLPSRPDTTAGTWAFGRDVRFRYRAESRYTRITAVVGVRSFTTICSSDEMHAGNPVRFHNSHQYRAISTRSPAANGFETVLTTWTKPRYDRDDELFILLGFFRRPWKHDPNVRCVVDRDDCNITRFRVQKQYATGSPQSRILLLSK